MTDSKPEKHNDVIEAVDAEKEADFDIPESSADKNSLPVDDSEEGLDSDQLKAFESIMAQLEGDSDNDADTGPETPQDDQANPESEDDFTAELEKVVKEANGDEPPSANADAPPPADADDSEEGLDADQQKALESIMAQIEGDSDNDADAEPETPQDDQANPEPEPEDDISAELEKVVIEANPDAPPPVDVDENEDNLDSDQIEAFESIMAQIEGDSDNDTDDEPETLQDDQAKPEPAITDSNEVAQDISDEIVLDENSDMDPEEEKSPEPSLPDGNEEKPIESEEKPFSIDPSDKLAQEEKPTAAKLESPRKTPPLREAPKPTGSRKKKAAIASIVIILLLGLAGYYYWPLKNIMKPKGPPSVSDDTTTNGVGVGHEEPVSQTQEPVIAEYGTSDDSRLKMAVENLEQLRNEIIEKKSDIEELRTYYQAGIDAEIKGVVDTVRQAGKDPKTYNDAMTDPRIRLGLEAIQRRDTYIKKLKTPENILFRKSESLLYYIRKARLLALMAGKTSDIDIDGFIQQADEITDLHRLTLAQLNIDNVPVTPLVLETLWKDISAQFPVKPAASGKKPTATETENKSIWKDICDGNFSEKHRLTILSTEAAGCLATWKGKDLFLNALTELSPEAARQLATWEGDWMGLNGLKELSPEVAVHLVQWKGRGLSLNGLSRLSPRVVAILSEWQGDQIELVNVKHMAHWENPKTRLFLSEDLKRKRN